MRGPPRCAVLWATLISTIAGFGLSIPSASEAAASMAPDANGRCEHNATAIINVYVHAQDEVAKNLLDWAHSTKVMDIEDAVLASTTAVPRRLAVGAYFSTVIDELNTELADYGVQLRTVIAHGANGVNTSGLSCTGPSSIETRTEKAAQKLIIAHPTQLNIHVLLFGCIDQGGNFSHRSFVTKGACGRVVGVQWTTDSKTRDDIKMALIQAIGSPKSTYEGGRLKVHRPALCGFTEMCLGMTPTDFGKRVIGETSIQNLGAHNDEVGPTP